jgi:acetoin utilization deacetylase AcuC-like enzyme
MLAIMPEPVATDLIRTVHSQDYMDILQWMSTSNQPQMRIDGDTYAQPHSYEIARLAAGGVVRAVDEVCSGRAHNALAAVRPPGHHARPDIGMGFCLLANVAIAARHAQRAFNLERILIIDYDVHHGNGTEEVFYHENDVLFVSTHQYPFYPGTGALEDIGAGAGEGYTVNIPLPPDHGDANFAGLYQEILWPLAERYQPQLIIVSAGFDAHWSDPLARMGLSLTGYAHLTRELIRMAQALCGGKIVFALEGGYNLDILGQGVCNIAHALLGDDTVSDLYGQSGRAEPNIQPHLERLKRLHKL